MFLSKRKIIIISGSIILVLLVVVSTFLIYKRIFPQNFSDAKEREISEIISAVNKLVVLPTDETPTVATVADPEKLKGQVFFANAEVGDKVLIYQNDKKAILYRPSLNKIIEITPIGPSSNLKQESP